MSGTGAQAEPGGLDPGVVAELRRTFAAALAHDDPDRSREELLGAGWLEALDADERASVALVFSAQGRIRHDAAALDDVVVSHVARRWPEAAPGAVAGEVAVAYPVSVGPEHHHVVFRAHRGARRLLWLGSGFGAGGVASGVASGVAGADRAAGSEPAAEVVDLEAELDGRAIGGVDPDLGLIGLQVRPPGRSWRLDGPGAGPVREEALAAGRVALSHQLVAGAQATLDLALSHARSRRQFGTPIGSFQAVRHRLADTLVALSMADAATVAAATTRSPVAAAAAKALAGRAAAVAGRNCLQVLGGIGFTLEHEFHRYFRRGLVLDRLLGDQKSIERELGGRLRTGDVGAERLVNLDDCPPAVLQPA